MARELVGSARLSPLWIVTHPSITLCLDGASGFPRLLGSVACVDSQRFVPT
jgi:hypothetical protein